jgi:lipoprotein-anchoring transpeptidase ErfK/SrfK
MGFVKKLVVAIAAIAALLMSPCWIWADSSDSQDDAAHYRRPGKWIEVVIAEQRLVAWENGRAVMSASVSTGTRHTPTPRGIFRIYSKRIKQRMRGADYDLPNVPYVMYFRRGGYALHGVYWHNQFGRPMSHGCVNLPTHVAAWLYRWAPIGTPVVIR